GSTALIVHRVFWFIELMLAPPGAHAYIVHRVFWFIELMLAPLSVSALFLFGGMRALSPLRQDTFLLHQTYIYQPLTILSFFLSFRFSFFFPNLKLLYCNRPCQPCNIFPSYQKR
ncbi:membrane-associated protein, putative, partial [Bodo saltans]